MMSSTIRSVTLLVLASYVSAGSGRRRRSNKCVGETACSTCLDLLADCGWCVNSQACYPGTSSAPDSGDSCDTGAWQWHTCNPIPAGCYNFDCPSSYSSCDGFQGSLSFTDDAIKIGQEFTGSSGCSGSLYCAYQVYYVGSTVYLNTSHGCRLEGEDCSWSYPPTLLGSSGDYTVNSDSSLSVTWSSGVTTDSAVKDASPGCESPSESGNGKWLGIVSVIVVGASSVVAIVIWRLRRREEKQNEFDIATKRSTERLIADEGVIMHNLFDRNTSADPVDSHENEACPEHL